MKSAFLFISTLDIGLYYLETAGANLMYSSGGMIQTDGMMCTNTNNSLLNLKLSQASVIMWVAPQSTSYLTVVMLYHFGEMYEIRGGVFSNSITYRLGKRQKRQYTIFGVLFLSIAGVWSKYKV